MTLKRTLYGAFLLLVAAGALRPVQAQTPGTCSLGSAATDLDINNVRARLYNNGGLFWKGAGNVYNVPKAQPGKPITPNAIFAGGIWLGGFVGSELRQAAATYSNWEFFPGPLGDNGELPGDKNCAKYDRIYSITQDQIKDYVNAGSAAPDLTDWPTGLGAPTFTDLNGDGRYSRATERAVVPTSREQKINLQANQLPLITGDQMAWWIMNDVGGTHRRTGSKPIGVEVQVSAFAFNLPGDLGNTTFYRYKLIYKGQQPLTNTFFGIFSDPDLGDAVDDYVGSDTTLGIGYVYNADNNDASSDGYGLAPPAAAYDFFQGPLVDAPGQSHRDPDGTVYQNKKRLAATTFVYYNNGGANNGDPDANTDHYYKFMSGRWKDGRAFYACGDGHAAQFATCGNARFMFPGDPTASGTARYWSEFQTLPTGAATNAPNDRRFAFATGPFTINPGDQQTIVYGIVWAKGADNIDSVRKMKAADALAQSAFNANFELPPPPDAPRVTVAELSESVILSWNYRVTDNNYFEGYEQFSPLTFDNGGDRTYNFEGYRVYRYTTAEFNDDDRELVATYDLANGVTTILEAANAEGEVLISTRGTDSGIQNAIRIDGLTNYKQYYFGVDAYAYNGNTDVNRSYGSTISRVVVTPSPVSSASGGTVIDPTNYGGVIRSTRSATSSGEGVITATILDPTRVTGDTYTVRFYNVDIRTATDTTTVITYDITNTTKGTKVFDGAAFAQRTGAAPEQRPDVVQAEGLSFTIQGPAPGIKTFLITRNAGGPLNPPEYGAADPNHRGFPRAGFEAGEDATPASQVGPATFGIHTFTDGNTATDGGFERFLIRATREGTLDPAIGTSDYEWRFTGSSIAYNAFQGGATYAVPFEIWDVGTKPDASDDVRLIPLINENTSASTTIPGVRAAPNLIFDLGPDHPTSGGLNDPQTDWVYWYRPDDVTPGQAGYNKWVADVGAGNASTSVQLHEEVFARVVLVNFNGGTQWTGPFNQALPETGTIFKIVTFKPNALNDQYTINTSTFAPRVGVDSVLTASVDEIAVVPNPYKGASSYEVSNLQDVARFINLPQEATIRVFTLSGTLVRTLRKSGAARFLDWDLQSESALPIASGMYLIHVEVPTPSGMQEKVIKFGVIKKRIQLDLL